METINNYLSTTANRQTTLSRILDLCQDQALKGGTFVQVEIPEDKVADITNYLVEVARLTVEPIQSTDRFEISWG